MFHCYYYLSTVDIFIMMCLYYIITDITQVEQPVLHHDII